MAVVLTSATSSQAQLDHAASDGWRTPPEEVETPVATQETENAETADVSETPEEKEGKEPKKKGGWQRKIDRLSKRVAELESEKEQMRARLGNDKQPETRQPEAASVKPSRAQFQNDEEYISALVRYERAEADKQEALQAEAAELKEVFDSYNRRVAEAKAEIDDFDEVVGQSVQIPSEVVLAIREMDNGPYVAYYLGEHPEICEELVNMRPLSAVRRIERISDELSKKEPDSHDKKPRSTPPPPVRAVSGTSTRSSIPLDQLSPGEYVRIRNQQVREREGRRR